MRVHMFSTGRQPFHLARVTVTLADVATKNIKLKKSIFANNIKYKIIKLTDNHDRFQRAILVEAFLAYKLLMGVDYGVVVL